MLNIKQEKETTTDLIANAVQEILYKGLRIDGTTLCHLDDEMNTMMRAMQARNKIYDYAVILIYDELFSHYNGRIAYSLINTEGMDEFEKNKVEDLIEFNF